MENLSKKISLAKRNLFNSRCTECGKYGKTSCNVFNQKIDYAPAEVSTRYGISGVKVSIFYIKKKGRVI